MSSPQITKNLFKLKKIVDKQKSNRGIEDTPVNNAVDSLLNSFNLEGDAWPKNTKTKMDTNMLSQ